MAESRSLPVLMPRIAEQRWSCHSCGNCCRTLAGHLTDAERERIERQQWGGELGLAPVVKVRRGWVLNKRADGACVFLDESNRCRIHSRFGEAAKPLACRIFPFSVRPVRRGWQASLRFDCPSVVGSKGEPIDGQRGWVRDLARELEHPGAMEDDTALLQRGLGATIEELDALNGRLLHWIASDEVAMTTRLIGAARLTATLRGATLKKVRGARFEELLDILLEMLPEQAAAVPAPPTRRQRGMLRQAVFAHAEHVSLAELLSGAGGRIAKRWRQLRSAKRFLKGEGLVPRLPGVKREVAFRAVESVAPAAEGSDDVDDLVRRYLTARIDGRTVFGAGYYGWPVFAGLGALCVLAAAAGWLARCIAAASDRTALTFEDVALALGVVDRAATRLPALGTIAERGRVLYLGQEDGLARLLLACRFSEG